MKYLSLLIPFTLFATVNEPLRLELLSGYRSDDIHWHFEGKDPYGEDYDNLQFWQNQLALRSIHRDIVFYAKGSYSAFGEKTVSRPALEVVTTHGFALDGMTHLGYAVNLTPDRTYNTMIVPLVGFSGHYEKIKRATMPKYYEQTFYGPYVGGAIRGDPGNGLHFEVGYAFNWLHLHLKDAYPTNSQVDFSGWGNHGQSGWVQMAIDLNYGWQLGALGTIDYIYSNVHQLSDDQQFILRWTPISGSLTLSKSF
jgi:hypothetical protein